MAGDGPIDVFALARGNDLPFIKEVSHKAVMHHASTSIIATSGPSRSPEVSEKQREKLGVHDAAIDQGNLVDGYGPAGYDRASDGRASVLLAVGGRSGPLSFL